MMRLEMSEGFAMYAEDRRMMWDMCVCVFVLYDLKQDHPYGVPHVLFYTTVLK